MKVTVSVTNFVRLMYCGAQADEANPVAVIVPQPMLQAVLSKTPSSDRPSHLTVHSMDFLDLTQDAVLSKTPPSHGPSHSTSHTVHSADFLDLTQDEGTNSEHDDALYINSTGMEEIGGGECWDIDG